MSYPLGRLGRGLAVAVGVPGLRYVWLCDVCRTVKPGSWAYDLQREGRCHILRKTSFIDSFNTYLLSTSMCQAFLEVLQGIKQSRKPVCLKLNLSGKPGSKQIMSSGDEV